MDSTTSNKDVLTPTVIQTAPVAQPTTADEVESTAISTRLRKIYDKFQFLGNGGLKDKSGTVLMDQSGLISTANFQVLNAHRAAIYTTSSGSYVDVPGVTITFTLPRDANVLFLYGGALKNSEAINGEQAFLGINVDGDEDFGGNASSVFGTGTPYQDSGVFIDVNPVSSSASYCGLMTAGTHTVKLQILSSGVGGGFPASVIDGDLSVIVFGT